MIIRVTPRGMLNTFFRHRNKFALTFLPIFGLAVAYCFHAVRQISRAMLTLLVQVCAPVSRVSSRTDMPSVRASPQQQLERKEVVNSQISVMQSQDLLVDVLNAVTIGAVYPVAHGHSRSEAAGGRPR